MLFGANCRSPMTRQSVARLWNATSPVNRLPNEILTKIFSVFTNPEDGGFLPRWAIINRNQPRLCPGAPPFGWLPLTLVCRRWWAVACTTPILWRTINIADPGDPLQLLQLALQRSENATLDVTFYGGHVTIAAGPVLRPHVARLRKLTFTENHKNKHLPLLSMLDSYMPNLDRLMVYGGLVPSRGVDPVAEGYTPISLSRTRFPSLTYLYVSSVIIAIEPPIPSTLCALTISDCTFDRAISLSAFLKMIEDCHALEILRLEGLPVDMSLSPISSSASFPNLKYLAVEDEQASRVARFLEAADVPRDVTFSFSSRYDLPDPPRFSSLLPPKFKTRFSVFTSVHSANIFITGSHMEMSFGGCRLKLEHSDPGSRWEKRWTCLSELPVVLDTSRLKHLSMRGEVFDAEEAHWRSLFEGALSLERFELYGLFRSNL
ncbi:hypothetical protein L226DRAFT_400738 [Lentinus tigrinus ALCF2SS1-7]|uniref:F-box domain-containing protein n=1 Tax=Lentinus tigrinus ALCF2SS1-6 TaxID=1328759 RepID=A0A5C2RT59_9APHY|nr:hypothetical protein L227DRAFT_349208 [Lentinus tigrinus ALCF2SS1-6]RPD67833.1 hypothetical protein L226DRAFT_400738 [Lentinus tigrinus ALCF2SS1-7]